MVKNIYSGTFYNASFEVDLQTEKHRETISEVHDMKQKTDTAKTPERTKRFGLLLIGALLLIAGILLAIYTYNTSYRESLLIDSALKEEKLRLQRPYSYSLALVFLAFFLTAKGIYNNIRRPGKANVTRLAMAGFLAALCYIGFAFFKIDIPNGPAFHFGNVFCVLAALLLGGYWGGLAGAIGMTIGDLTTIYVTSAPKTFLLKFMIGLIVGLVAHQFLKLGRDHSARYVTGATVAACISGMAFNIVADPVVGYFYKTYLLGIPQDLAKSLAQISAVTTAVNAVIAVILASAFYLALRPALKKAGLFVQVGVSDT